MNRLLFVVLALALLVPISCDKPKPKKAAAPAVQSTADLYRDAFARIERDLSTAAANVSLTPSGPKVEDGSPFDQTAAKLRANAGIVNDLMKAAAMDECSFNVSRASGSGAEDKEVLDLCLQLRGAGRLLKADAVRAWMEGDTAGATDRVVAILGLSAHASREPVMVVSLTTVAIEMLAVETAKQFAGGVAGKSLSKTEKQKLLAAMNRLDKADPAGVTRAESAEGKPLPTADIKSKLNESLAGMRAVLEK